MPSLSPDELDSLLLERPACPSRPTEYDRVLSSVGTWHDLFWFFPPFLGRNFIALLLHSGQVIAHSDMSPEEVFEWASRISRGYPWNVNFANYAHPVPAAAAHPAPAAAAHPAPAAVAHPAPAAAQPMPAEQQIPLVPEMPLAPAMPLALAPAMPLALVPAMPAMPVVPTMRSQSCVSPRATKEGVPKKRNFRWQAPSTMHAQTLEDMGNKMGAQKLEVCSFNEDVCLSPFRL